MYLIEYVEAFRWKVLDENHQAVFVGTKRQVEDWLDRQENLLRQRSPRLSVERLMYSLRQAMHRLTSRLSPHADARIGQTGMHSHASKH